MLHGEKTYLRALEPTDIDLMCEWENNVEVWKISDTVEPFSRYKMEQYVMSVHDIHQNKQLRFVICNRETNEAVGCVDLFDFNPIHARVGVGILIAETENRKQGFASEALGLIKEYCFRILDCENVYCNILDDNSASISLFEKQGFNLVGTKNNWIRYGGKYYNEHMYQCQRPAE